MGVLKYLLGLVFITAVSLLSFLVCLWQVDPYQARWQELALFYLSLFLTLLGLFSLLGIFFRRWRSQFYLRIEMIKPAFRQGFLLSALVIILLVLQAGGKLTLLKSLIFVLLALITEAILGKSAKK